MLTNLYICFLVVSLPGIIESSHQNQRSKNHFHFFQHFSCEIGELEKLASNRVIAFSLFKKLGFWCDIRAMFLPVIEEESSTLRGPCLSQLASQSAAVELCMVTSATTAQCKASVTVALSHGIRPQGASKVEVKEKQRCSPQNRSSSSYERNLGKELLFAQESAVHSKHSRTLAGLLSVESKLFWPHKLVPGCRSAK